VKPAAFLTLGGGGLLTGVLVAPQMFRSGKFVAAAR